jgi:hypothetical protein
MIATSSGITSISDAQTDAFYRAATLGLAWLDARESSPRRFGPAADASWRNYAGVPADLTDLDRLELLLRDAASLYPDAFSPRVVFALHGLTDDEPFGQWDRTPAPGLARDAFRAQGTLTRDVTTLLRDAARAWSRPVGVVADLPPVGPTTRVLAVGAGALIALATRFAQDRALSFREQVLVLTDDPAVRHLAALAALALGSLRAPGCVSTTAEPAELTARRVLVSADDATTDERAAAERLLAASSR